MRSPGRMSAAPCSAMARLARTSAAAIASASPSRIAASGSAAPRSAAAPIRSTAHRRFTGGGGGGGADRRRTAHLQTPDRVGDLLPGAARADGGLLRQAGLVQQPDRPRPPPDRPHPLSSALLSITPARGGAAR